MNRAGMFRRFGFAGLVTAILLSMYQPASALIEAPHNRDNKISCGNCHGTQLGNSPFWGQGVGENPFNAFCYAACHNTGVGRFSAAGAPMVKTHSSATTNSDISRGTWGYQCIDCHQPHSHQQNNWEARKNSSASLYLASGLLAIVPAPAYDPDSETTTLTISTMTMNNGWTVDGLKGKSDLFRGTIFIPVEMLPNYNYAIYDMTATTITVHGDVRTAPWIPYLGYYNFKIIYGQYIRSIIDVNKTPDDKNDDSQVKFLDRTGPNSFAHNDMLGGDIDGDGNPDDSTVTGICQVCHTRTDHWRNDGTLAAMAGSIHENTNGTDCTECHWHSQGFKHGGDGTGADCAACHNSGNHQSHLLAWAYCSSCHDIDHIPALADGNDLASTTVCGSCHKNPSTGLGPNVSGFKDAWGTTDPANPAYLDLDCRGCHDGRPKADYSDAVYTHDPASTCTDCHTAHKQECHGAGNEADHLHVDIDGKPIDCPHDDDPGRLVCSSCHDGTGSTTGLPAGQDWQRPRVGMRSAGHERLVSTKWIRQYDCYFCHTASVDDNFVLKEFHANGSVDVAIDPKWYITTAVPAAPAPTYVGGICYSTYCHTDGTEKTPVTREYKWDEGHKGCNACHGHDPSENECSTCHDDGREWSEEELWISAMPMYASGEEGKDGANSHFRHLFTTLSCDECHNKTVVGACLDCHHRQYTPGRDCMECHVHTPATEAAIGTKDCIDCHHETDPAKASCSDCHNGIPHGNMSEANHINPDYHVNKTKDVLFPTYSGQTGVYNQEGMTCSNTKCHTNASTDPVWGGSRTSGITCAECHRTNGADYDDFGGFNDKPARINLAEWENAGHGRKAASGPYPVSDNPAADFPSNGCWYCHDSEVVHKVEENPFRLKQHEHFKLRFAKECVYCHMVGENSECLNCHNDGLSLAPQLDDIPKTHQFDGSADICADCHRDPAEYENPPVLVDHGDCSSLKCHGGSVPALWNDVGHDHSSFNVSGTIDGDPSCVATCHADNDHRHKLDVVDVWTQEQKDDVENQYVMMGVCLKCHDDDSGGQCQACHQGEQYKIGYDPGMPGTGFKMPAQAKASSFHFGYKHYKAYEKSVQADPDNPVWKGGKFCWDCHDPHGDKNTEGTYNIYMIQGKVATQTDGLYGKPIEDKRADVVFTNNFDGSYYAKKDPPYNGICNVCHDDDTDNPDRARHYNRNNGDMHNPSRRCTSCHEHRFTDSHAGGENCNKCHESKPVPRHTAFGQPRDCTKCHDGILEIQGGMNRVDIMMQFRDSQSHHIQREDGTYKNTDCYQCHWEATELGLINVTYHEGFNHLNHSGTSGAKVDLVIWAAEESPGVDVEETKGSRPKVYDNAAPHEDDTAVTFVATELSLGSGDAVTDLQAERAQVENVTSHCLGCHSKKNSDSEPFDDCKTPRQYAWDNTSIDERYSDDGITTWGKYTGYPKSAQKNLQKAFSAHGNAVGNAGGFSTTTGVDSGIDNTRANDQTVDGIGYNVQCYDCHSSHGSMVIGTTSSYRTFNGEKEGGNLKETKAGVGGYKNTYFASEYANPAAVNFYNAGAGQCFDCHETPNAGDVAESGHKVPWGYKSTFGAEKPIIGYRDNPRFNSVDDDSVNHGYPGIPESIEYQAGVAASKVSFAYRANKSTMGGHMNASHKLPPGDNRRTPGFDDTTMNSTVYGEIDGLCTPCHDPHGVSPTLKDDMAYGVPLLKGTWLTSPYKEDHPPPLPYGNKISTDNEQVPANPGAETWGDGYRFNQPTPYNPVNYFNIDRVTFDDKQNNTRIAEDDQQFAGLCLRCHPRQKSDGSVNLEDGDTDHGDAAEQFKGLDRVHETVKGWGDNDEHSFPCSKCHQPHASGLPRLLATNCLNFSHRGGVESGGIPTWSYRRYSSSIYHGEQRGFPVAGLLTLGRNNGVYDDRPPDANTSCHNQADNNPGTGSAKSFWNPAVNLWNEVSPW